MMDLSDLDAMLAQADAQSAKLHKDYRHLKKKVDSGGTNNRKVRGSTKNGASSVSRKRQQTLSTNTAKVKQSSRSGGRPMVSPRVRQAAKASAQSRTTRISPTTNSNRNKRSLNKESAAAANRFVNKVTSKSGRKVGGTGRSNNSSNRNSNNSSSHRTTSLERAKQRAEAREMAKLRQEVRSKAKARGLNGSARSVPKSAPGKLQGEKLPSIFSRPQLKLSKGTSRAVIQRPREVALVRKLPSLK